MTTEDLNKKHIENSRNKNLFKMAYRGKAKPFKAQKLPKSAKLHVEKITNAKAESVLDIGCGSGDILFALQELGLNDLYGSELTPEAIDLATKRFETFGDISKVKFIEGDITDLDLPAVDSTSLHRVICCYFNVEEMIEKTVEKKPKTIMITIPRYRTYTKILTFFENIFLKLLSIFKPSIRGVESYLHNPAYVDSLLNEKGYEKTFSNKERYWETNEYQLK